MLTESKTNFDVTFFLLIGQEAEHNLGRDMLDVPFIRFNYLHAIMIQINTINSSFTWMT